MAELPEIPALMEGMASLKPMQHSSAQLRGWLAGFDSVPISEGAAQVIEGLQQHLADPAWCKSHDAAHKALAKAKDIAEGLAPEQASQQQLFHGLYQAQLPSIQSLDALQEPQLRKALGPVRAHLQTQTGGLTPWTQLTPRRMKAEPRLLLAEHRAATATAPKLGTPTAEPVPVPAPKPKRKPKAEALYTPSAPPRVQEQPKNSFFHRHGPLCNHDHGAAPSASGGRVASTSARASRGSKTAAHVHGPNCGHDHHHGASGIRAAFSEALPRGKAARWAWLGAGGAALGAVGISLLGRNDAERERERGKSAEDKAGDVAYTINHALSCGTTDVVLQPVIAAAFGVNVGCGHPEHHHPQEKLTLKSFAHEAGHYFKGEVVGDFIAVPMTIGVQRMFPDFMHGLRKLLEPLTGWAFRLGANHTAQQWGRKAGFADDSAEVKARADMIYEHEVEHLPQAAVWNMFAYPIGAFGQKAMGHGRGYGEIFKSKLVGAAVSNGLLIGGRMVAPGAAQQWDKVLGDNVFMPVGRVVGKAFGVDESTMEKVQKKHADMGWQERLEHEKETSPATAAALQA